MNHVWKISTLVLAAALTFVVTSNGNKADADQPRMREAIASLNTARDLLQKAEADKDGHREKAIRLANEAISEAQAGMEYARTHP